MSSSNNNSKDKLLPNPEVPSLFDAAGGTGNFRATSKKKVPTAAAFEGKPTQVKANLPESPTSKRQPKKLVLPGVTTKEAPSLFADSAKYFDKATGGGGGGAGGGGGV